MHTNARVTGLLFHSKQDLCVLAWIIQVLQSKIMPLIFRHLGQNSTLQLLGRVLFYRVMDVCINIEE